MIAVFLRRIGSAISRVGWGVADQGLSSLTNFTLGVAVARSLDPSEFGAFSIAFGVYTLGLGIARALSSEPLMVRYSGVPSTEWHDGARAATGTAICVGALTGIACLGTALVTHGALASALMALGFTMPGLLLQDTWRFAFFSADRGSAAFINDLVWGLVLLSSIALLLFAGHPSVFWLVLVWGASGSVASLVGILQARILPIPSLAATWFRAQRDLIPRFTAEFGVTTLVAQVTVIGIGVLAGLAEVGAIRAAQILLGPLSVIYLGVSLAGLPQAIRALQDSKTRLRRACMVWATQLAVCALAAGVFASMLPDWVGRMLLGTNWSLAQEVVLPLSVSMAGSGVIMGAGIGLRALAAAKMSLRARLLAAPVVLIASLFGAATWGARGAAWGFAFASAIGSIVWWRSFSAGLRDYQDTRAGSQGVGSEPSALSIPEAGLHA